MRFAIVLASGMLVCCGCGMNDEPGTRPVGGDVSATRGPGGGVIMSGVDGGNDVGATRGPGGGVMVAGGGGGGSGGAAQAVRGAAVRTVAMNDMHNLRIFLENASLASGQMPDKQEIMQAAKQGDPKLANLLEEGDIVLTGVRQREGIWAFTKNLQGGQHIVLSQGGVERMAPDQLQQRLQNQ